MGFDGSDPQLYDVINDPGETTNIANKHREVVARLTKQLIDWKQTLPASLELEKN